MCGLRWLAPKVLRMNTECKSVRVLSKSTNAPLVEVDAAAVVSWARPDQLTMWSRQAKSNSRNGCGLEPPGGVRVLGARGVQGGRG